MGLSTPGRSSGIRARGECDTPAEIEPRMFCRSLRENDRPNSHYGAVSNAGSVEAGCDGQSSRRWRRRRCFGKRRDGRGNSGKANSTRR